MVEFPGFTREDFEAFAIPEFHDRMFYIRSQIRPKLAQLGDDVAPKLSSVDHPLFPHTASHARRRINPPEDTWVAFSRSPKAYKRYAHFEIGLDRQQVFVRFVVKPEGQDDKPQLLAYLKAAGVAAFKLVDPEPIHYYQDDHGRFPQDITTLDEAMVGSIIETTAKKSHGFAVGMVLHRSNPVVASASLVAKCVNMITHLTPLYRHSIAAEVVDLHG